MHQRKRRGHTWRKLKRRVAREEHVCWLCGEPIDDELDFPDPRSRSVDHVEPVAVRPELEYVRSNLRAAHLGCNQRRGKRQGSPQPAPKADKVRSRDW